ncbi:MAG TPA: nucleotidyltransferase domain-containing protein [Pricia sp.]|nr:nucleotidyltransferase domain-containing protein [Pricia sp.]
MALKEDILQFLTEHKEEFFARFQLIKIGLFGSHSKNTATDYSDIDIIVEFQPDTKDLSGKKAELKAAITSRFKTEVDICREKYIKPYFKDQILASAIYV